MGRGKLKQFRSIAQADNVIEPGKEFYEHAAGNWHQQHFKNTNPITLELACGRGEYTTGLAKVFPNRNFIGVDIKGDRIYKGSITAKEQDLSNASFLRCQIQTLKNFFKAEEIETIWIVHPDPRPRRRDIKRRLVSPAYLDLYKYLINPKGTIHLKTDNHGLFLYALEVLASKQHEIELLDYTFDLYNSPLNAQHYGIITNFEKKFHEKGENIHYLSFRFRN